MKYRLLILDADVVIEAVKCGFWNSLISQCKIQLCKTICDEVKFYYDDDQNKISIDLQPYVNSGTVEIVEVEVALIAKLESETNEFIFESIHPGEQELIALVKYDQNYCDHFICTGDIAALRVLSAHGLSTQAISLEALLKEVKQEAKLPNKSYSEHAFKKAVADGSLQKDSIKKKK